MTRDERDAEFVTALERDRAVLQGTAFLLLDDPTSAARLLEATLAELYAQGLAPAALRRESLRRLVSDDTQPTLLPWSRAREFELVDGAPPAQTSGIHAHLARLPREQRTVIVLEQFTGLSAAQIADVLDQPVAEVERLAHEARSALTTGLAATRPSQHLLGGPATEEHLTVERLAEELRSAVPDDWRTAWGAAADIDHGRRLIRHRRLRRGATAVAAMVALIVLVSQLWPQPTPPPSAAPAPSSVGPTPVIQARCDVSDPTCQTAVLEDWRTEMARVVNTHLEAGQQSSFGYDPSATMPTTFWSGQGGALALDLLLDQSGLQLSLQIASSSDFAQVCGATTRTTCTTTRYMDGNRFTISDSRPDRGIEVQYSPYGDQVITAVVRRIGPAKTRDDAELSISRGDLVDLLQDRRLRLPGL